SDRLIETIAEVWPELPPLLGTHWEQFEMAVLIQLRALEAAPPQTIGLVLDALLSLFERYPAAWKLLVAARAQRNASQVRGEGRCAPQLPGSVKHDRYLEVPVFYATDRAPTGDPDPDHYYSGDRCKPIRLNFGMVRVSVPDDHRMGALEKPRWWKLQFRQDPK